MQVPGSQSKDKPIPTQISPKDCQRNEVDQDFCNVTLKLNVDLSYFPRLQPSHGGGTLSPEGVSTHVPR